MNFAADWIRMTEAQKLDAARKLVGPAPNPDDYDPHEEGISAYARELVAKDDLEDLVLDLEQSAMPLARVLAGTPKPGDEGQLHFLSRRLERLRKAVDKLTEEAA